MEHKIMRGDRAMFAFEAKSHKTKEAQETIEAFLKDAFQGEYGIYREVAKYRVDTKVVKETVDETE